MQQHTPFNRILRFLRFVCGTMAVAILPGIRQRVCLQDESYVNQMEKCSGLWILLRLSGFIFKSPRNKKENALAISFRSVYNLQCMNI